MTGEDAHTKDILRNIRLKSPHYYYPKISKDSLEGIMLDMGFSEESFPVFEVIASPTIFSTSEP